MYVGTIVEFLLKITKKKKKKKKSVQSDAFHQAGKSDESRGRDCYEDTGTMPTGVHKATELAPSDVHPRVL